MNILAVDTALAACSAAIVEAGRVTARAFELRRRGHAEALMPMVARLMAERGLDFAAIERFAVTVGPGTFTGTRVGLAAVRGWAVATGGTALGLSTLEVIAAGAAKTADAPAGSRILVAIDARRGEVYSQCFTVGTAWWELTAQSQAVAAPVETAAAGDPPDLIVGSGMPQVLEIVTPRAQPSAALASEPDAAIVGLMAGHRELPAPYLPPRPFYLRPPDAKLPS